MGLLYANNYKRRVKAVEYTSKFRKTYMLCDTVLVLSPYQHRKE